MKSCFNGILKRFVPMFYELLYLKSIAAFIVYLLLSIYIKKYCNNHNLPNSIKCNLIASQKGSFIKPI